ncbi:hypothetical protein PPERSA_08023 [Pseudocohnilembus persalinus]|uniref:Uncharacterized protein n=1 Tax=Pseudocohnilembus persalinus TaxID=266149 RepID=A0A0V0R3C8_PSEPJ|nr:hypothetical protein PPERSA_08023 [Pseudocohnilembus persalinus]|eukprot:KRX08712.1 hypothetical protein PPERSA_08023 [Pseudocohnilembus persalinus]
MNKVKVQDTQKQYQPLPKNINTLMYLTQYLKINVTPAKMTQLLNTMEGRVNLNKLFLNILKLAELNNKNKLKINNKVLGEADKAADTIKKGMSTFNLFNFASSFLSIYGSVSDVKKILQELKKQKKNKNEKFKQNGINSQNKYKLRDLYLNLGEGACNINDTLMLTFMDIDFLGLNKKSLGKYIVVLFQISLTLKLIINSVKTKIKFDDINEKRKHIVQFLGSQNKQTISKILSDDSNQSESTENSDQETQEQIKNNNNSEQKLQQKLNIQRDNLKQSENSFMDLQISLLKIVIDFFVCLIDFSNTFDSSSKLLKIFKNQSKIQAYLGVTSAIIGGCQQIKQSQQ